ncbi:hypothetical protein BLAT2472_11101 [Burkholderia latens]
MHTVNRRILLVSRLHGGASGDNVRLIDAPRTRARRAG